MKRKIGLLAILCLPALAQGRGVSPYLPLNLDPEAEREVERVLILGDVPVLRRPIPAALVLEALPRACMIDAALCDRVQRYLTRYMHDSGVQFASVEGSTGTDRSLILPNSHGQDARGSWQVALAAYLQLADHALLSLGGVAYDGGRAAPTGTMLSLGFDFAQLDIGWRDHWWSPTTGGSMLISTEAPTMPSITLSNYRPLTGLRVQYELFLARMSYSSQIQTSPNGVLTQGHPKMAGIHLAIQPVEGWTLGGNRILVFGGGAAGGQTPKDILNAFFDPARAQTDGFGDGRPVVGKQEASVTSAFVFPGRVPFSVYAEYAGNDTSTGANYFLGKPDLAFGIHFPRLGPFDLTLESSTWQPTWYVHPYSPVQTGYGDGISNDHLTIGGWFGEQRLFGDAVGGESQLIRIGWEPRSGGRLEAQLRMLRNDSFYSALPYKREYLGTLSYAHPWRGYVLGGQVDAGRDVLGQHYARLSGFLRIGNALWTGGEDPAGEPGTYKGRPGSEVFLDVGANANKVRQDLYAGSDQTLSRLGYGPHVGIGARRAVSEHQDLGMRLDADDIQGRLMLGVRALDYRYRTDGPLAFNVFLGAARYSLATPAMGWYVGMGPQWRNVLPGWDLSATARWGMRVARLRVLPTDPYPMQGRVDSFYGIYTVSLSLSHAL